MLTTMLADELRWKGSGLCASGRASEAEALYRSSLEISTQIGYDAGRGHALNCMATLALRRGETSAAEPLLNDALTVADACANDLLIAIVRQNLGILADIAGNSPSALDHFEKSIHVF